MLFQSPLHDIKDATSFNNFLNTVKKLLSDFLEDKCPTLQCKCIFYEILFATKSLQMLEEHLKKEKFLVERLFLDTVFIFETAIHNVFRTSMPPKIVFINVARMLNEDEEFMRANFHKTLPENALDACLCNYNTDILSDENYLEDCIELEDFSVRHERLPGLENYFEMEDEDISV